MTLVGEVLGGLLEDQVVDSGDVARALHMSPRSVARWQAAEATPRREAEERLLELKAVVDLLRTVLRPEPARLWLRSPSPDLDYDKPLDRVAKGDYRRVVTAILALGEGITA